MTTANTVRARPASSLPGLIILLVVGVLLLVAVVKPPAQKQPEGDALRAMTELPPAPPADLRGPVWDLAEVGLWVRIPDGWSDVTRRKRRYLMRNVERPLIGNVNLVVLPNLYGRDLAGLEEESLRELHDNPNFDVLDSRRLEIDGRPVLRFDYSGTPEQREERFRFTGFVFTHGTQQGVLTVTAIEDAWPEVEPVVEELVDGMRFAPR